MIIIFLLALIARLVLVATLPSDDNVFSDQLYLDYARNLAEGKGFYAELSYDTTGSFKAYAFRPPLFPLVWGLLYNITGGRYLPIRAGLAVLSAVGCVFVFPIGMRLFERRSVAVLGGLAAALYPPLVWNGVHLMTEPFFIFFQTVAVYLILRAAQGHSPLAAILGGVAMGLAILSRSVLIGFVPVAAAWILWRAKPRKQAVLLAICFFYGAAFTVAPWSVRNYFVLREFVPVTTDGGHGFYIGNNPKTAEDPRGFYMPRDWPFLADIPKAELDEVEVDRALYREGLRFIAHNPGAWLKLLGRKFCWLWRFYPHPGYIATRYVILYALSYLPVFPFMILGIITAPRLLTSWRRDHVLIYLLVGFTTAMHMIYIATIRYRVPLMPFLLLFAAFGLICVCDRIKGRRNKTAPAIT